MLRDSIQRPGETQPAVGAQQAGGALPSSAPHRGRAAVLPLRPTRPRLPPACSHAGTAGVVLPLGIAVLMHSNIVVAFRQPEAPPGAEPGVMAWALGKVQLALEWVVVPLFAVALQLPHGAPHAPCPAPCRGAAGPNGRM